VNYKRNVITKVKLNSLFFVSTLFIRVAIGCVFLLGSIPKLRQPYDFLSSIYNYELVGPKLGMFIAMTLPWVEILIGICLIGGIFIGGALLASAGMATVFTIALSSVLYRGLEISCGCFGTNAEIISFFTVIRPFLILIFSLFAYIVGTYLYPLSRTSSATI